MEVACPTCEATLALPDGAEGKQARCPRCQAVFRVTTNSGATDPISASGTLGPSQAFGGPATPAATDPRTGLPLAEFKLGRADAVGCPGCQRTLAFTPQSAGHAVICPSCGTRSQMPASPPPGRELERGPAPDYRFAGSTTTPIDRGQTFGTPAVPDPYAAPPASGPLTTGPVMPNYAAAGWGLIIVGGISFLFNLVALAMLLLMTVAVNQQPDELFGLVLNAIWSLSSLAMHLVMVVGGLRMTQRRSLSLVRAAAIMACIPCFGCFPIQLPVGIWAVILAYNSQSPKYFQD